MIPPNEALTSQGYDLQMGTNVIGPYLFTTLLVSHGVHSLTGP